MESRNSESYFGPKSGVKELTPKDFDEVAVWKLKDNKCSVVLFYAPWCGHCHAFKDAYASLGKKAAFFGVCAFNCEKYKGHMEKIRNDMPGLVGGYPTVVFYKNGQPAETYNDERTVEKLLKACMGFCKKD
jgi:thiol-disulfide isomerase/thioredoxin